MGIFTFFIIGIYIIEKTVLINALRDVSHIAGWGFLIMKYMSV